MKTLLKLALLIVTASLIWGGLLSAQPGPQSGDVMTVIKRELQRRGARFGELKLDVIGSVSETLEVARIEYDPVHAKNYFQLRDSHKHAFEVGVSGSILFPALVAAHDIAASEELSANAAAVEYRPLTALASPSIEELAGRYARRKIAAGEVLRPEMFSQALSLSGAAAFATALVVAGRPATLTVQGVGFVLSRQVAPLDSGGEGQAVRVRAPDSNHIFKAVVVGRDQLKGEQQ